DQIHPVWGHPRDVQRRPARRNGQVGGHDVLVDEMTRLDPGSIADPFVGGVEERLEPGVRHESKWERGAHARDRRVAHRPSISSGGVAARRDRTAAHAGDLTNPSAASGEPTATASVPGATRLASLVKTSPGPASTNVVAPAPASARAHDSHRTGDTTCRPSKSRTSSGSSTSAPVTFSAIGKRRALNSVRASASTMGAIAGSMSGEWNAPATFNRP